MKLTVKQYASRFNISVQAVYQALKQERLKEIIEDGQKFVIVDDAEIEAIQAPIQEPVQSVVKQLLKQLKTKDDHIDSLTKEIRRLSKKLEKCGRNKEKVLLSYISELKQLQQIEHSTEEIIEVKPEKKKRKKKRKSRKK